MTFNQEPLREHLARLRKRAHDVRQKNVYNRRLEILRLSRMQPVTNAMVRKFFSVSRQSATADLRYLQRSGYLVKSGKNKGTVYTATGRSAQD